MKWSQIRTAYEKDLFSSKVAPGLRKATKLTPDHVDLTPRSRMRVNLAAQVMIDIVILF